MPYLYNVKALLGSVLTEIASPSKVSALHSVVALVKLPLPVHSCHGKYCTCWHLERGFRGVRELRLHDLGVLCISAAALELLAFSQTIDNVLTPKALEGRYSASIGEPRGSSGRCVDLLALFKAQQVPQT